MKRISLAGLILLLIYGVAYPWPWAGGGGSGGVASIVDNTITSAMILDNTIASAKMLDNTLLGGKINSSAAMPNGVTATTQAANDNSTKLATTAYVDQFANYHRIIVDGPTTSDNVTFAGPMDRSQIIDNVVMMVQSTNGVRTGATTDNVTINFAYCAADNTEWASCTTIFTADNVVTGAATASPTVNNPNVPATYYLRMGISASNMSLKKLYIRIRYRSNL